MANSPGGSLTDGAAAGTGSNAASGNDARNSISTTTTPHLRPRQLPLLDAATARRSGRTTPNPYRSARLSSGLGGGEASGSCCEEKKKNKKKRKAPPTEKAAAAPFGISEAAKVGGSAAPLTPRDPNISYYTPKDGAGGRLGGRAATAENAGCSPSKRRCTRISNYMSQFTPVSKGRAAGT